MKRLPKKVFAIDVDKTLIDMGSNLNYHLIEALKLEKIRNCSTEFILSTAYAIRHLVGEVKVDENLVPLRKVILELLRKEGFEVDAVICSSSPYAECGNDLYFGQYYKDYIAVLEILFQKNPDVLKKLYPKSVNLKPSAFFPFLSISKNGYWNVENDFRNIAETEISLNPSEKITSLEIIDFHNYVQEKITNKIDLRIVSMRKAMTENEESQRILEKGMMIQYIFDNFIEKDPEQSLHMIVLDDKESVIDTCSIANQELKRQRLDHQITGILVNMQSLSQNFEF